MATSNDKSQIGNQHSPVSSRDLKATKPQQRTLYHGVSKDVALNGDPALNVEGFVYDAPRKEPIVSENTICGCFGVDYGVIIHDDNSKSILGVTCVKPSYATMPEEKSKRLKHDQNGAIIQATYVLQITVGITLDYNEIFYPRKDDGVDEIQSKLIYLHELGHQLDGRAIVPLTGRTFIETVHNTFSGNNERITLDLQLWADSVQKNLVEKYTVKIDTELKTAYDLYHKTFLNDGNPWDGRI